MKPTSAGARTVFAIVSLTVVLLGVFAICGSPVLGYRNWWGGLVFGPFAIPVGALLFFVLVIHPERIEKSRGKRQN